MSTEPEDLPDDLPDDLDDEGERTTKIPAYDVASFARRATSATDDADDRVTIESYCTAFITKKALEGAPYLNDADVTEERISEEEPFPLQSVIR